MTFCDVLPAKTDENIYYWVCIDYIIYYRYLYLQDCLRGNHKYGIELQYSYKPRVHQYISRQ